MLLYLLREADSDGAIFGVGFVVTDQMRREFSEMAADHRLVPDCSN